MYVAIHVCLDMPWTLAHPGPARIAAQSPVDLLRLLSSAEDQEPGAIGIPAGAQQEPGAALLPKSIQLEWN